MIKSFLRRPKPVTFVCKVRPDTLPEKSCPVRSEISKHIKAISREINVSGEVVEPEDFKGTLVEASLQGESIELGRLKGKGGDLLPFDTRVICNEWNKIWLISVMREEDYSELERRIYWNYEKNGEITLRFTLDHYYKRSFWRPWRDNIYPPILVWSSSIEINSGETLAEDSVLGRGPASIMVN